MSVSSSAAKKGILLDVATRRRRRVALVEVVGLALAAVLFVAAATAFDWVRRLERFFHAAGLARWDEMVLAAGFLAIGVGVFALRRWREAEVELGHRRKAEAELRELRDELESRVARRTAELESANAALRLENVERRHAEEVSRDAWERYRALFERSRDCIYTLSFAGEILDANPAALALIGYSIEELRGRRIAEFLEPDEQVVAMARIESVRTSGQQSGVNAFRLRCKDGHQVDIETAISVVFREGAPYALQGVGRDITERVRAEVALRRSEENLRLATSVARVGIFEHDLATQAFFASELLQRMMQIESSTGDVLAIFRERVYADDLARLQGALARAREPQSDGAVDCEHRVQLPDGSIHWLHVKAQTWFAGEGAERRAVRVVGAVSDITDRKRSLQRQQLQYEVTVALSEGGAMTQVNQRMLATLARGLEADIGELWIVDRALGGLRCIECWPQPLPPPEEGKPAIKRAAPEGSPAYRIWRSGMPSWSCDMGAESGGRDRPRPLRNWIGLPITLHDEVLGVMEFSTSRGREWDERMLGVLGAVGVQFAQYLERQKLAEQFRQAQKMEAIGTLAGGIAHDFNNIIAGISGYTELARMELGREHRVAPHLEAVLKGANRGAALVRQILTFSRQQESDRKPLQIRYVVNEALSLLRATIPRTVQFETAIARDLPNVLADPIQIHQVVMNLCTNAWHAMRERPGRLGVTLELCEVDENIAATHPQLRLGRYVRLSVSDTGHGMDAATLTRIFEPFFTTKAPGEGTGLGLSVVHGIMQSHEGVVTVYSQPGEGSVFRLYFPICSGEAAEARADGGELPRGNGENVLYVDDDLALAQMGKRILESIGYHVDYHTDPATALAAVRAAPRRYHLVVTDLAMPTMAGTDLARALRDAAPQIPIVLVTGFAGNLSPAHARLLGVNEMLLKPLSIQTLALTVRRTLAESKAR